MKHIGFSGGSSVCELGSPSDMATFFKCIDLYVIQKFPRKDFSLLTDRLYCRYLRLEELGAASLLMEDVRSEFAKISSSEIDWNNTGVNITESTLDLSAHTLADVFKKYFECFNDCVSSARWFYEDWKKYLAVRVTISDIPEFNIEKLRALEEYDALEGSPFWLR